MQEGGDVSKRQQKILARTQKRYEATVSNSRPVPTVTKKKTKSSMRSILFYVVLSLLGIGVTVWMKRTESYYTALNQISEKLDFSPYEVLQVDKRASRETIRKSYRQLNLEWHPDRRQNCDETCHQMFNRINEAYKILSSDEKRSLYDATGNVYKVPSSTFTADMQPFEYSYTPSIWDNVVKPSLEGKQLGLPSHVSGVWMALVIDPKASVAEYFLPLWSDLAARYYGRVSFLRINETDSSVQSRLPFKLRISPTLFMMSSADRFNIYSGMVDFRISQLNSWIASEMPNIFERWEGSDAELGEYLTKGSADGRLPVAVISRHLPNSVLKSAAIKYWSTIQWIQPRNSDFMLTMGLQNEFSKIKGGAMVGRLGLKPHALLLPNGLWTIEKLDNTRKETVPHDITESQSGKAHRTITEAISTFITNNEIVGVQENYHALCGGIHDNATICAVYPEDRRQRKGVEEGMKQAKEYAARNGLNLQRLLLPVQHKVSQLSKMLNRCSVVLLDASENQIACVTDMEWTYIEKPDQCFPRRRKSNFSMFIDFVRQRPRTMATVLGSMVIIVYVIRKLLHWNSRTSTE